MIVAPNADSTSSAKSRAAARQAMRVNPCPDLPAQVWTDRRAAASGGEHRAQRRAASGATELGLFHAGEGVLVRVVHLAAGGGQLEHQVGRVAQRVGVDDGEGALEVHQLR